MPIYDPAYVPFGECVFVLWLILAVLCLPLALIVAVAWLMAVMVAGLVRLVALLLGLSVGAGLLSALSLRRARAAVQRRQMANREPVAGLTRDEINAMRVSLGLPPR